MGIEAMGIEWNRAAPMSSNTIAVAAMFRPRSWLRRRTRGGRADGG